MPFGKGKSGNPTGRPHGAKDKHPRGAKAAIRQLLDDFGNDTDLIKRVLLRGLEARAPSSFPYLRLLVEQQVGAAEQPVNVVTKVVHEHRES